MLRPFARLPVVPADRLEEIGHNLAQGLVGLRRPGLALWVLFLSVASWVLLGISVWLVFESFDLGVGVVAGIFAAIAAGLTAVLPAGPSGIGVFDEKSEARDPKTAGICSVSAAHGSRVGSRRVSDRTRSATHSAAVEFAGSTHTRRAASAGGLQ